MSIQITTVAEQAAYDFGWSLSSSLPADQADDIGRRYAFHHQFSTGLSFSTCYARLLGAFLSGYNGEAPA